MSKTLAALLNNPEDLQRSLQPVLRQLPDITSLVLIIAIAHILALITWMLLSEPETTAIAPRTTVKTTPQTDNQLFFRQLTNAHLFGIMGKSQTTATTKAPETRLNLILKGILADDPMKNASVIISRSAGSKEEVYGLGDKMPGGITIKEIHAEHIILERKGQLETLRLKKESGVDKIALTKTTTPSQTSTSETLKTIRSNIVSNPSTFTDYAMPIVVKDKKGQIGYRLKAKQNGELLKHIGIQPADVITSVNGIKLTSPKNSMNALRKLSTASELNITVLRKGIEVPLNITLQ